MKWIRIIPLLLSVGILFSLLGCEKIDLSGDKNPSTQQTDGEPEVSDGTTLIVKTTVTGDDTFRPEGGVSLKGDKILQQIQQTEQTLGVTIDVGIVSEETLQTTFLRACKSGKRYADLIQTDAAFLAQYHNEGYFLSLSEAGLDASVTGSLTTPEGVPYALRADGWNHPLPTASGLIYYNQKLFTEAGCETPLELQEAGAWSWTNFESLCKEITKAYSGEVFALAHPTKEEPDLVWASLHAVGLRYFDQNGTCIMNSETGRDGFYALQSLLSSGVTYRLGSYENNEADPSAKLAFTNGRTALLVGNASLLFETGETSLSENLREDLRVIGFPGKNGVPFVQFGKNDVFCGIPATANTELCEKVLPTLFAKTEDADFEQEMMEEFFYYETDGESYFDLLKNASTDTSLLFGENRSLVEDYFIQIANGQLSATEYLNNLQLIINATKG